MNDKKSCFRIGFDLDGTAWKYQLVFQELAYYLKQDKHSVGIITAHTVNMKNADRRLYHARGFEKPDFYYAKEISEQHLSSKHWKIQKAIDKNIDLFIDDFDSYQQLYIVTRTEVTKTLQKLIDQITDLLLSRLPNITILRHTFNEDNYESTTFRKYKNYS